MREAGRRISVVRAMPKSPRPQPEISKGSSSFRRRFRMPAGAMTAGLLFLGAMYLVVAGLEYYSRPSRESQLENQPAYYHQLGGATMMLGVFLALAGILAAASLVGWRRRGAWRVLGILSLATGGALAHWPPFAFLLLLVGVGCLLAGQRVRRKPSPGEHSALSREALIASFARESDPSQ